LRALVRKLCGSQTDGKAALEDRPSSGRQGKLKVVQLDFNGYLKTYWWVVSTAEGVSVSDGFSHSRASRERKN
jgi:hypothetical protein